MFLTFFRFELSFWLRGMMLYVFLGIISLLFFGATASDQVRVGSALANGYRNSPFVVQNFYAASSILCMLMITAFVNAAALRDFAYGTHEMLFTKPLSKFGYFWGKFLGSTLIAVIPMLGVSVGVFLASQMPWNEPSQWGPNAWRPHLMGVILFAAPNAFIVAALIYSISLWLRSTMAAFISTILLLIGYTIAQQMLSNLDNEQLAVMLDPFGVRTFSLVTKYWTVADRNTLSLSLGGLLLWNRLLWLGAASAVVALSYVRFAFAIPARGGKRRAVEEAPAVIGTPPLADFRNDGFGAAWSKLVSQIGVEFWSTVRSNVFLVVMLAGLVNTTASLMLSSSEGFGLAALPVTYRMIEILRGSMYLFLIAVVVFYAGVAVWKEREAKLNEVFDALPHPTWIAYVAKLVSLLLIVAVVLALSWLAGVLNQSLRGYTRFQTLQYFVEFMVLDLFQFGALAVLAMFCHVVSPNKYVGYFSFVVILLLNAFAWNLVSVDSLLVQYGATPSYLYSDMFGIGPFVHGLIAFNVYWGLFAVLLSVAAILLWRRGSEDGYRAMWRQAPGRFRGGLRVTAAMTVVLWGAVGGWLYYNTQIVNAYPGGEQQKQLQANYEKQFHSHAEHPQPRVRSVKYNIDVYPSRRKLNLRGVQQITNPWDAPIERLFLNTAADYETEVEVERARLTHSHDDLHYYEYEFDPPLQPGETVQMTYVVTYEPKGIENQVRVRQIVQNGTFFNNGVVPQIGYQPTQQLQNRRDRKRLGLSESELMPPLDPSNLAARGDTYISNSSDWVDVETTISTSSDQIAVAPGSLVRRWEKDGRNYFHYKVDHPSLNMYSFISARYKVAIQKWRDVDIEVYYHPEHEWNVENMLRSIRDSLEYYSTHFGPYRHKQARIIEFPRIASFAQAFPGTMPYSEGIGFIADIHDEDDIDMVYYVVAHEMAHQWWAHQVIGANMEGATLLSETLAQYSALMVMEQEYGRDMMRKFLKYEMDNYLSSRGSEMLDEKPLLHVRANQGYVHYRKGSVVMYHLKEMIGEDKVNLALRSLVDQFAYQGPPYPTSQDLVDALREQTPEEYQSLIDDLFTQITLFANRTTNASVSELGDGKFRVTLDVECRKFQADAKGLESEIEMDDWIEIGAFAEPEAGRRYGATLHRERMRVKQRESHFEFIVDERPALAGVDPFFLLVDRQPDDNLKRPR